MEISSNIIANCSDFVWSLNTEDISIIRETLKKIEEVTNFMLCITATEFSMEEQTYIPINPELVEKYTNNEDEEYIHDDLGVDLFNVVKMYDKSVTKDSYTESDFYKKYLINHGKFMVEGKVVTERKKAFSDILFFESFHLPNEDGIFKIKGYGGSKEIKVRYQDGYCDEKFVMDEDQPQAKQLRFYAEVLRHIGGTFHHEDGGYSQADWHAKWFKENGYEDILPLGDGDPDNCDEDV